MDRKDIITDTQKKGARNLLESKKSHSPNYLNEYIELYRMAQKFELIGMQRENTKLQNAGCTAMCAIEEMVASEHPELCINNT